PRIKESTRNDYRAAFKRFLWMLQPAPNCRLVFRRTTAKRFHRVALFGDSLCTQRRRRDSWWRDRVRKQLWAGYLMDKPTSKRFASEGYLLPRARRPHFPLAAEDVRNTTTAKKGESSVSHLHGLSAETRRPVGSLGVNVRWRTLRPGFTGTARADP